MNGIKTIHPHDIMAKPMQSVSKRTRSKSKRSSLSRQTDAVVTMRDASTSFVAAAPFNSAASDERLYCTSHGDGRANDERLNCVTQAGPTTADAPDRRLQVLNGTAMMVSPSAAILGSNDKPPPSPPARIDKGDSTNNDIHNSHNCRKRSVVCYDATTNVTKKALLGAKKAVATAKPLASKRQCSVDKSNPKTEVVYKVCRQQEMKTNQSVTPAAFEKNADVDIGSNDDQVLASVASTKEGGDGKKEDSHSNIDTSRNEGALGLDEETPAASIMSENLLQLNRSLKDKEQPQSQLATNGLQVSFVPAFHQLWHQPYKPAVSKNRNDGATSSGTTAYLPPGVIDIDATPHACCLHSQQSHAGYSWITSVRRCGCSRDSNHNSGVCMTEAYLGTYGAERYGAIGLSGFVTVEGSSEGAIRSTLNEGDWKAEQWWLNQTYKELEASVLAFSLRGRGSNTHCPLKNHLDETRTPSPNSSLSFVSSSILGTHDTTGPLQLPHPFNSSQLQVSLLSSNVEKHVDYMSRQPYITIEMRRILMDWLSEVAEEYKLSTETFWLSVTLVDRSLACFYGFAHGDGKGKKSRKRDTSTSIICGEMLVHKEKIQLVGR